MNKRANLVVVVTTLAACSAGARAQASPTRAIQISPTALRVINDSSDDEFDPHTKGDLISYTQVRAAFGDARIRYTTHSGGPDLFVPFANVTTPGGGSSYSDYLSFISGTKIAFVRTPNAGVASKGAHLMLFETASPAAPPFALTRPHFYRYTAGFAGDTLVYLESVPNNGGAPWRVGVIDTARGTTTIIDESTATTALESPSISAGGDAVVYNRCSPDCDVWAARRFVVPSSFPGTIWWQTSQIDGDPLSSGVPHTDGTYAVWANYEMLLPATKHQVVVYPLAGGPTTIAYEGALVPLSISVSRGVVAFSLIDSAGLSDLYLYDIATRRLFQATNTPTAAEHLTEIEVLAKGRLRMVWDVTLQTPMAQRDVYAATFSIPPLKCLELTATKCRELPPDGEFP